MRVEDAIANTTQVRYAFATLATFLHMTSYRYPARPVVKDGDAFDYIIVGGGTAGSVLASRLSEDQNVSVLVLEAGGDPPLEANLPSTYEYLFQSNVDWNLQSQVDEAGFQCLRNKRLTLSQGKMLGGSSSINIMRYVRGDPHDYDTWAEMTDDPSWGYANVLPYFMKSERLEDQKLKNSPYGHFFGRNGPIGITKIYSEDVRKYLTALEELGHEIVEDTNTNVTLGFSEAMLAAVNGLRQSTANTYLYEAKNRANLYVLRYSTATKILIDENKVAKGVQYVNQYNETFKAYAKKEVIISAGPLHSPQLLLLSGIGPRKQLEDFGIDVIADLPVGERLLNHHGIILLFKTQKVDPSIEPPSKDPGDFPTPEITGFVALNKSQKYPDYQASGDILSAEIFATAACYILFGFDVKTCQEIYEDSVGRELFMVEIQDFIKKSRGRVSLKSKDPLDSPDIHIVAYPDDDSFNTMVDYAFDFGRIVNSTFFKSVDGELASLSRCKEFDKHQREYLECYANCLSSSIFHYVSTCAMGWVVDSQLFVYGIVGLRVVDSSVMPTIPSGNTCAPTVMIAEKAADMIKETNKSK